MPFESHMSFQINMSIHTFFFCGSLCKESESELERAFIAKYACAYKEFVLVS